MTSMTGGAFVSVAAISGLLSGLGAGVAGGLGVGAGAGVGAGCGAGALAFSTVSGCASMKSSNRRSYLHL